MEVTPQEIVGRAADLLEEFGWVRHAYAVDANYEQVSAWDKRVAAFCAVGALQRAALDFGVCTWEQTDNNPFTLACDLVCRSVGKSITHWNDVLAEPGEVPATLRRIAGRSNRLRTREQVPAIIGV